MKKELRPVHDHVVCDVCGRTILKGERTEAFLAPGGQRRVVCELCFGRAEHHGWIRESTAGELSLRPARSEPRRSLFGRLRKRSEPAQQQPAPPQWEEGYAEPAQAYGEHDGWEEAADPEAEPAPAVEERPPPPRRRSQPKDPRHVRAVPSTVEGRIERALELFNGSPHQRTTAGLARTLGVPWVTAMPQADQPSAVTVLVAWELSWYRYRVDLGDELDPVALQEKGEEIEQIDESLRNWNATLDEEGRLAADHAANGGDER